MKKTVSKIMIAILAVALAFGLVGCGTKDGTAIRKKTVRAKTELDAEEYIEYADEIFLNTEKYPALARNGLFLVTGFEYKNNGYTPVEEVPTEEVLQKHFDPNKNILILINGLQVNTGRYEKAYIGASCYAAETAAFAEDETYCKNKISYFSEEDAGTYYDFSKIWSDGGYNVFYFHWESFADYYSTGTALDAAVGALNTEWQIWSTEKGIRGSYSDEGIIKNTEGTDATNGGCIAEWYVAEYIRTVRSLQKCYPSYDAKNKDIRVAAHSMGGVLGLAGTTLLKIVAEKGQVDDEWTPNRLALLDSYGGEPFTANIAWTGLPCTEDTPYLTALRMMKDFGVATEFYANEGFLVPFLCIEGLNETLYSTENGAFVGNNEHTANAVLECCPLVMIRPYFVGVGGSVALNGHNPLREWYLMSLLYDAPSADGDAVPTARMSDEEIKNRRGKYYEMQNERTYACETVRCDDDEFRAWTKGVIE